jgi:hypothetical protein
MKRDTSEEVKRIARAMATYALRAIRLFWKRYMADVTPVIARKMNWGAALRSKAPSENRNGIWISDVQVIKAPRSASNGKG